MAAKAPNGFAAEGHSRQLAIRLSMAMFVLVGAESDRTISTASIPGLALTEILEGIRAFSADRRKMAEVGPAGLLRRAAPGDVTIHPTGSCSESWESARTSAIPCSDESARPCAHAAEAAWSPNATREMSSQRSARPCQAGLSGAPAASRTAAAIPPSRIAR